MVSTVVDPDADARFDAIVGIERSEQGVQHGSERGGATAPERTSASRTAVLSPAERRRRAGLTLGLLLAGAALVGSAVVVVGGGLPLGGAGKLAGSTTPIGDERVLPVAVPDATAVFGTAATLGDGVTVLVSEPTSYAPSRKATGDDQAETLVYTVTISNTGDDAVSPGLSFSATAGGVAGTPIFDAAEGIGRPGAASIEAGESRTFRVGFSTASPDSELTVGSGLRAVRFTAG